MFELVEMLLGYGSFAVEPGLGLDSTAGSYTFDEFE